MAKIPVPVPIFDTLERLPNALNQKLTTNLDFAQSNLHLAYGFLKQYDGNKATYNCYRREIERFLQWSWLIHKTSVLDLTRDDIESFIKFCMEPPKSWISVRKFPKFVNNAGELIPNKDWRPFVVKPTKASLDELDITMYKLSQKTIHEIFVALGSFYTYLNAEGILDRNPVQAIKQKSKYIRKSQTSTAIRRLTDTQWKYVINTAKQMANEDPDKHERTLFIISALYLMFLRVSELVESHRWSPQMNHFYQDSYRNWWFKTVGKGNKSRNIAVNNDMIEALKRWRKHLGLSPVLPTLDDNNHLIPKLRGRGNITDTKSLYLIVQNCFNTAAHKLKLDNKHEEGENLIQASTHWLRHTGISDSINKYDRPVAHVRDDAGHASITTTDKYNDITLLERHESAQNSKIEE